jgi:enamine deaminase RidA (YjgF/YER057c/UK114 family)
MPPITMSSPPALGKPLGAYSQIARVKTSELVFIAGQVGASGALDFATQCSEVFANIKTALESVGAGWANVVQLTTYLVHSQDIPAFHTWRQSAFPGMFANGAYPPNTLLMIDRLVHESFLIEVQTVAAL